MTVATSVSSQHKKKSGQNNQTECEETDKEDDLVPKKGRETWHI